MLDPISMFDPGSAGDPPFIKCSRAGCTQAAIKHISWRNPRIHLDGRRKIWSACGEHEKFLLDYLGSRGFEPQLKELE